MIVREGVHPSPLFFINSFVINGLDATEACKIVIPNGL